MDCIFSRVRYVLYIPTLVIGMLATVAVAGGVTNPAGGIAWKALHAWTIVVAEDAEPSEHYAAEEFQRFHALAAGVSLPIQSAPGGDAPGHIFIGPDMPNAGDMKPSATAADLGSEDARIVITDTAIRISGGRPRGTLYGVYTFLEDYLGVRFLTADQTHVPAITSQTHVAPTNRTVRPPLEFRSSYTLEMTRNPVFATRLRNNTVTSDPRLGGRTPMRLINHSFGHYLPVKTYGATHPEYYSEINGRRPVDISDDQFNPGVQLCLTNPDVLRIVTAGVLRDLEAQPDRTNISVSQNDNVNFCRCAACHAIDEREGSPMGSLLTFVNAVADAIAPLHPDVMVGTLAYKYSRTPPRTVRPRPNVQIQLCSIECCMNHAIDDPDCPLNAPFRADMDAWGRLSEQVYVWDYMANFANYLLPAANLPNLGADIRYFVRNGARGILMQGAYNAAGSEFVDLRNYVVSRMLWDPALDDRQLIDEFLDLHYAEASGPLREWIALTHAQAVASQRHQRCSRPGWHYGFNRQTAAAGIQLFEHALALAGDDTIRQRVERIAISAHILMIDALLDARATMTIFWRLRQNRRLIAFGTPSSALVAARPHVRRVFELSERHGVNFLSEWVSLEQARKAFREIYQLADDAEF